METIRQIDGSILVWIQEHMRNPVLSDSLIFLTHLCDHGEIWIVTALILLLFQKTRKPALFVLIALLFSYLFNNCLLKNAVARTRPYEVVDHLVRLIEKQKDYSFPSGHTGSSFAAATVLFSLFPKKYSFLAIVLAVLIAFSRLYVGVHYPTDVLAGMLSGTVLGLLSVCLYKKTQNETKKSNDSVK